MMTFIVILYLLLNTVAWMKSDEPYSFRVHYFFIPYMFSNYKTFNQWYIGYTNIIKSTLFENKYQVDSYIKRILYNNYTTIFVENQIYDIKIRRKDGFKVYLYSYSNKLINTYTMEMDLFERLHSKVEIVVIYQKFVK